MNLFALLTLACAAQVVVVSSAGQRPATPAPEFQLPATILEKQAENSNSFSPAQLMLAESNRLRGQDCQPSPELTAAAQWYANYLARTGQQGHFAFGDSEYRARQHGFTGTLVGSLKPNGRHGIGEVLSFGPRSVPDAFASWMNSPNHKAAVLEPTYNVCGFGYAVGASGPVWCGMYGRDAESPPAAYVAAMNRPLARSQSCANGFCQPAASAPQKYRPRQEASKGESYRGERPRLLRRGAVFPNAPWNN